MCLSAGALPRKLPRCAQRAFANFVCDPCVATAAYDRHHDNPLSRDSPPRQPTTTALPTAPLSEDTPCLVPCLHALSYGMPCPKSLSYDSCLSQSLSRPPDLMCSFTSGLSGCSSGHGRDNPCRPQSSPFRSVSPPLGASWRSWCCRQGATQGWSNHHAP